MRIELEDCGYTIIFNEKNGTFRADRHGEPWRDLTGDNMVLCMAQEIERLREKLKKVEEHDHNAGPSER